MTSTDVSSQRPNARPVASFGNHRGYDLPASAISAGANTRPGLFANKDRAPARPAGPSNDLPPNLVDNALRPFVRIFGTEKRALIGLACIAFAATGLAWVL